MKKICEKSIKFKPKISQNEIAFNEYITRKSITEVDQNTEFFSLTQTKSSLKVHKVKNQVNWLKNTSYLLCDNFNIQELLPLKKKRIW